VAGFGQVLSGQQARRAAPDNGDAGMVGHKSRADATGWQDTAPPRRNASIGLAI
jgi:hypothetical protein